MKKLAVLLALLVACNDEAPKPSPVTSAGPATAAAPTSASATSASTASAAPAAMTAVPIDEAGFKALHQLKAAQAPAPKGEMLTLSDGSKAYLALPEGEAPFPALVVIHEWWGLNGHIKHWSDRLANTGYAALAVDLYGGKTADNPDDAMTLMKAVDAEAAKKTLLAAYGWLGTDPRVKATKRGAIGWCFGGKWSLELALAAPDLDAAVVYYGHVETDAGRLAELQAPLLAIFGTRDKALNPDFVKKFSFGLEQAGGKDFEVLSYEGDHAFANPSNERYDEKAAGRAWDKVQGFLKSKLRR